MQCWSLRTIINRGEWSKLLLIIWFAILQAVVLILCLTHTASIFNSKAPLMHVSDEFDIIIALFYRFNVALTWLLLRIIASYLTTLSALIDNYCHRKRFVRIMMNNFLSSSWIVLLLLLHHLTTIWNSTVVEICPILLVIDASNTVCLSSAEMSLSKWDLLPIRLVVLLKSTLIIEAVLCRKSL